MNKKILENAQKYCNDEIFKEGSNFYYSFLHLEKREKDAISSTLSFYKKVYGISNNSKDKDLNLIKLNWWKKEISNTYNDKPSHPISIAMKCAIQNFGIEKKLFMNIIKGVHLELNKNISII